VSDTVRRPGTTAALLRSFSGCLGATLVALVLLMAVFAPLLAPADPIAVNLAAKLAAPSAAHWLGTDQTGRDLLSRILYGARPSLSVGILAVVIGLLGGCSIGLTAGYYRGWWEQVAMRAMDGLASIPLLIWAIAVVGIVGVGPFQIGPWTLPNEAKITLLIGIFYMPPLARVTHGGALAEAASDYVSARRTQGASDRAIMLGDILPNCLSPVVVQATLLIAVGIIVEASLSFIGLGVEPPAPSWGSMLANARNFVFTGQWWMSVFPGLAISISVIGFNLLGDALRDALDPRHAGGADATAGLLG
jgi:peptide/nickel transport system permease protein